MEEETTIERLWPAVLRLDALQWRGWREPGRIDLDATLRAAESAARLLFGLSGGGEIDVKWIERCWPQWADAEGHSLYERAAAARQLLLELAAQSEGVPEAVPILPGTVTRCRRCGRMLRDPEAIALGIGRICAVREALELEGRGRM